MTDILISTATIINPQINSAAQDLMRSALELGLLGLVAGVGWLVKLGINSMKSGWKRTVAQRLVSFAAQRIVPNDDKRRYVAIKMHEKFPRLSAEEIDHLLEEAVVNLKANFVALNKK